MILLTPNEDNNFDMKNFPNGLLKISDLNEELNTDKSRLFVLAVGREGPPVAALRYNLKDLSFPFVFEVTSDNLIFPYTPEAWLKSSNSKDTVALTAILSADEYLATPSNTEWVGFGLSEPIVIAGTNGRTTAKLAVSNKIDKSLYTAIEVSNLGGIDKALDRLQGIVTEPLDVSLAPAPTPTVAPKK